MAGCWRSPTTTRTRGWGDGDWVFEASLGRFHKAQGQAGFILVAPFSQCPRARDELSAVGLSTPGRRSVPSQAKSTLNLHRRHGLNLLSRFAKATQDAGDNFDGFRVSHQKPKRAICSPTTPMVLDALQTLVPEAPSSTEQSRSASMKHRAPSRRTATSEVSS